MTPTLLTRDQLDARLVDGERLLLTQEGPEAGWRCRVMYREEEVPMDVFTEYRDRGMLRSIGDTNLFM